MTETLLGSSVASFIGVTVLLIGFASWMTGRAVAGTWRSAWQVVGYGLALAAVSRFLKWSLMDADGLSVSGFLIDLAYVILMGLTAYRFTRARNMVRQYPWLYERRGPLSWREKM